MEPWRQELDKSKANGDMGQTPLKVEGGATQGERGSGEGEGAECEYMLLTQGEEVGERGWSQFPPEAWLSA
jgi:hypothetical protein